jgi:hypothetical protein
MNLIARHILDTALSIPIVDTENAVCAVSGEKLSLACHKKDVIGENFTDHTYLRHKSDYISPDVAKCILPVVNGNSLRNYSFFATPFELRLLKREEIWPLLSAEKPLPFVLAVTFSNKKHIAFKALPQFDAIRYTIFTDVAACHFDFQRLYPAMEIMQSWYTIQPDKAGTQAQPAFFSKANIAGETLPAAAQIEAYGAGRFFEENHILEQYRGTLVFRVLCHLLNKIA